MSKAVLIDTTKCIGCRSCQVSCKEWNGLPGEVTAVPRAGLGLQNPVTVSSKTLTLMTYHEVAREDAPGGLKYIFAKRQCMHCDDPACVSACPVTALRKTMEGPVTYDSGKCIGCRYCVWACPFGAPTVEWNSLAPEIRKCTMCYDRISQAAPEARNGKKLSDDEKRLHAQQESVPVCVKQCPSGALKFGDKQELLAEAKERIKTHGQKYVDHIYGEHEAGGTSTFYLSSVPFAALEFPQIGTFPYPGESAAALHSVPLSVVGMGALLGGSYAVYQRRAAVTQSEPAGATVNVPSVAAAAGPYKPIGRQEAPPPATPIAVPGRSSLDLGLREVLKFFVGMGAILLLFRLAAGWGASAQLSASRPWWPWVFSDTVWMGAIAGALLTGVLLYLLRNHTLRTGRDPGHRDGRPGSPAGHVEFAVAPGNGESSSIRLLKWLVAFGVLSFLFRFVVGLGGSTNLSDTYPWGLWIAFDFAWISVAAGAFATAGLIYIFHREDLYPLGRSAVLMGLLSYTFVVVVLLADLGLPWHFWQLGVQTPRHSAMFEVSWCIFLYLTVLAFEFLPIPCERWGLAPVMELWRKYSPLYVVAAVTLFTYLMSRNLEYAALALGVFSFLAFVFRPRPGEKPVPILLAIAAVTLSTMHQSSLGSLYLLMPDKLDALWWSPVMPLYYFLSSLAAGTALVILLEMWIAKSYRRALPIRQLAALGKITLLSLFVYEVVRVADVVLRGQLPRALSGRPAGLFLTETAVFGVLPLLLLLGSRLRRQPGTLGAAAWLTVVGVVFNRANAVFFAMNLRGPMPQIAPSAYVPSVWEWGISLGSVAAAVLLFRWAAQTLPVLPKQDGQQFVSAD